METSSDKLQAGLYALLVHLACVAALFLGLSWTHETQTVSLPGPIIEAELVGPTKTATQAASSKPPKPAEKPPEPVEPASKPVESSDASAAQQKQQEEEKRQEQKRQEAIAEQQRQDKLEQERVAALAADQAEKKKREQEEKKRQEQILLEEKKEQERKEKEKRQKEIEKELAKIKTEREAAEKKVKLEKERLAQLADQKKAQQQKAEQERLRQALEAEEAQAQTGGNGEDDSLLAQYVAAVQNTVTHNWNRPENVPADLVCPIEIVQLPGGQVISASVVNPCNADQVTRTSIEQAVYRASPLPYQGYEKVFSRTIIFRFRVANNG